METRQSSPVLVTPQFKVVSPIAERAETFLRAKKAEQVSKNTIRIYHANLNLFLAWCDSQFLQSLEEIFPDTLRMFLLHLKEEGHNPGGCNSCYRTLRTFFRWFVEEMESDWRNPCERVKAPRLVDEPQAVITLEEIEKLFRAASGKMAARDRAVILALADSGMRAAELLALNVQDVDSFTGELRIVKGKGGKSRTAFLGKRARRSLRAMLKSHGREAVLFASDEGTRLTYSGLKQILQRLSKKAGIHYIPPHGYRRCFAIEFLRSGGDLLSLQRILGHSGLSLLGKYARQSTDDLAAKHSACSPVDKGAL